MANESSAIPHTFGNELNLFIMDLPESICKSLVVYTGDFALTSDFPFSAVPS